MVHAARVDCFLLQLKGCSLGKAIEPPVSVSKADEQLAGKDRKAEAQKCLDYAAHDLSYCVVR